MITHNHTGVGRSITSLVGLMIVLLMSVMPEALAVDNPGPVPVDNKQLKIQLEKTQRLLNQPEKIQQLLKQNKITEKEIPDPHWKIEGCLSCHLGKATKANKNLRTTDINGLCGNCHKTRESHSIIHPVEISPDRKMIRRMPADFSRVIKQSGGKINCLTCHDVVQTCKTSRKQSQLVNPKFFRGGNYKEDRTRLCFYCHDEGMYERLNPHKQVRKDGSINEKLCYVCHEDWPGVDLVANEGPFYFNVENNYSSMCNGCHPWKPHPGGSFFSFQKKNKNINHLVIPPDKIMRQMEKSSVHLPLEPKTKRVYCATCHNPHDKTVIKRKAAAMGAGQKHFLRAGQICMNCHAR